MRSPEDIARTLWGALTCGCPSHTEKAIAAALRVERAEVERLRAVAERARLAIQAYVDDDECCCGVDDEGYSDGTCQYCMGHEWLSALLPGNSLASEWVTRTETAERELFIARDQRDKWRDEANGWRDDARRVMADVMHLRAEVESLRAVAERHRIMVLLVEDLRLIVSLPTSLEAVYWNCRAAHDDKEPADA